MMKHHAVVHNSPSALRQGSGQAPLKASLRRGYAFLISVLFIGIIAAGVAAVLALMGTSVIRSAITIEDAAIAIGHARTCEERALRTLRSDLDYTGNQTFLFADGRCRILTISGIGNEDRHLCVEGQSADAVRRMEIVMSQVLPTVRLRSWREVGMFTLCAP